MTKFQATSLPYGGGNLKDIVEYEMSAGVALEIGLLTDGAAGCGWFAEWAKKDPTSKVYVYTFGGFIGGYVYGERAEFQSILEFADSAETMAAKVWYELQNAEVL